MTSSDVRKRVLGAIGDDWSHTNIHGVELRRCLVDIPRQIDLIVPPPEEGSAPFWLVLEEIPGGDGGYLVVYDETSTEFGLARFAPNAPPYLIGIYGDFFDALEAM